MHDQRKIWDLLVPCPSSQGSCPASQKAANSPPCRTDSFLLHLATRYHYPWPLEDLLEPLQVSMDGNNKLLV